MKIGVLGIGRLGLCFALNLSQHFEVCGYDIREDYIKSLADWRAWFDSPEPFVNEMLSSTSASFTSDIEEVKKSDVLFIMVNTPSQADGSFYHGNIDSILSNLKDFTGPIVISSTVMPGYCDSLNDSRIVYNPQFIAQGSIIMDQQRPDFILIGSENDAYTDVLQQIYTSLCGPSWTYKVMNRVSAEITKLAINCYTTAKISFANMIGDICNLSGANYENVLSAVGSDKRVGRHCFNYGYGFGGPCFPRDNRALASFIESKGVNASLCRATDEFNFDHIQQQLKLISMNVLPENVQMIDNEFIITGVSYKANSEILDESQQLKLAFALAKTHKVTIRESEYLVNQLKSEYGNFFNYEVIL